MGPIELGCTHPKLQEVCSQGPLVELPKVEVPALDALSQLVEVAETKVVQQFAYVASTGPDSRVAILIIRHLSIPCDFLMSSRGRFADNPRLASKFMFIMHEAWRVSKRICSKSFKISDNLEVSLRRRTLRNL